MHSHYEIAADLILVGCVKSKLSSTAAARDLYNSPLWRRRRAYAERAGVPWYILSAEHGLLDPETRIAPYDLALSDLPAVKRREWSKRVFNDLAARVKVLRGTTIEVHAGKSYIESGLGARLRDSGATVRRPLERVPGIGQQLRWYAERLT